MATSFMPPADIVIRGGNVITVNPNDEVREAVAIKGNKIAVVGSWADVEPFIGPTTRIVDLKGQTVMPGFIDNHIHLTFSQRSWLQLGPEYVSSIEEIKTLVAQRAQETPPGEWIWGSRYHPERLKEGRQPNRHDLDSVSPNHPVGFAHREHMEWTFNTAGLRRIGVQDDTPDPPGGPMDRDDSGAPLGPMYDNTRAVFVFPNLPEVTEDALVEDYRWWCRELNRYGITSIYEAFISKKSEVAAWRRVREEGNLTLRVNFGPYPLFGEQWEKDSVATKMFEAGLYTGFGDAWIKMGSLTYGVDGGVFGPMAALFEPYSHDPRGKFSGNFRVTPETADAFSLTAHKNGWQISAVCHGDRGITVAVDAMEKAQKAYPGLHLRHRLEHAYLWNPELLQRVGELGIIWNTQLPVMVAMGRWKTHEAWGSRARWGFPVKSALEHGIVVSGGADFPVGNFDPMVGIHALVTRRMEPLEDGDVLYPEEAVSVLEAIRIYTYNGAYTAFEEDSKGSLEVGKLADLVVLSGDILTISLDQIRDLRAVLTIVDGKVVYDAKEDSR